MKAQELSQIIGKKASWIIFDLDVPVEITDARNIFGRLDVCIRPVGGSGEHWCSSKALIFDEGGI
jgi:hypothetical protein